MKLSIESRANGERIVPVADEPKLDLAIALGELAHERLLGVLLDNNEVSPGHYKATAQMLFGMAAQAVGAEPGRWAAAGWQWRWSMRCPPGNTEKRRW